MSGYPTITVINFGPITNATVELAPFTCLVGASNTGKSYLAMLVYAIHNALVQQERSFNRPYFDNELPQGKKLIDKTLEWILSIKSSEDRTFTFEKLPAFVQTFLKATTKRYISRVNHQLAIELSRCFSCDLRDLIRSRSHSAQIIINLPQAGFEWALELRENTLATVSISRNWNSITYWVPGLSKDYVNAAASKISKRSHDELLEDASMTLRFLTSQSWSHYNLGLPSNSYFFPAARSGLMQVLGAAYKVALRGKYTLFDDGYDSQFLGIVGDFLSELPNDRRRHIPKAKRGAAKFIEDHILHGRLVNTRESGGMPEYQTDNVAIPLFRASSMVAEIAPVAHVLKRIDASNSLILLEEPEAHLHAANQTKIALALALLVNSGCHVFITTHSDFLLQAVGNLLRLGFIHPGQRARFPDLKDFALDPADFYGMRLTPLSGGVKGELLKVDADRGIRYLEADVVASELYDISVQLSQILSDEKNSKKTGKED